MARFQGSLDSEDRQAIVFRRDRASKNKSPGLLDMILAFHRKQRTDFLGRESDKLC